MKLIVSPVDVHWTIRLLDTLMPSSKFNDVDEIVWLIQARRGSPSMSGSYLRYDFRTLTFQETDLILWMQRARACGLGTHVSLQGRNKKLALAIRRLSILIKDGP